MLNTGILWQAVKLVRHNTGFLQTSLSLRGLTEISSVDIFLAVYIACVHSELKVGFEFKLWIFMDQIRSSV